MEIASNLEPMGAIYYAIGPQYVREALISARSMRAAMPDLPLAIFTDEAVPEGYFDKCIATDPTVGFKAQKIVSLKRSPFLKTLYLDTDTYVVKPVPELFDLLDTHDVALAQSPLGRLPNGWEGVPSCFPVLNCGVIAFRQSPNMSRLLDDWLELQGDTDERDQPPFRRALYRSAVRLVTLTNQYNLKFDFPQSISRDVKILHGRHPNLAAVGQRVQPIAEVTPMLPVSYLHKTRVLGRKTPGPRASELLKQLLKRIAGKARQAG